MGIDIQGIVVIVGNFGSGKTEVAINLALACRRRKPAVRVVDLDLVNPYFRTREARNLLLAHDIEIVLPPAAYLNADLPVLSRAVAGAIRQPGPLTILDVGGDRVGATVLAALGDAFRDRKVEMLQVVNPHRPQTDTVSGCLAMRRDIEVASRLTVTGWVGNAHLMDATTPETILTGYRFTADVGRSSGRPLAFITVPQSLMAALPAKVIDCPVLPIQRRLRPPWQATPTCLTRHPTRPAVGPDHDKE